MIKIAICHMQTAYTKVSLHMCSLFKCRTEHMQADLIMGN